MYKIGYSVLRNVPCGNTRLPTIIQSIELSSEFDVVFVAFMHELANDESLDLMKSSYIYVDECMMPKN